MSGTFSPSSDYWKTLQVTPQDVEILHTHLFEIETPLTTRDLSLIFIDARINSERESRAKERQAGGRTFLPKEKYSIGDALVFPALEWQKGRVTATRSGVNPDAGEFDVITVALADGSEKMFAAGLASHVLNEERVLASEEESLNLQMVLNENGNVIEQKLEAALSKDENLVKIAGRWFPRGLLVDVNEGHLNLAEAAMDMTQGEPLPASALLKDVELPAGVNPKLAEFSLNYALQNDDRFDEVGPSGEVLWCLRRLEPDGVREVPSTLQYSRIEFDRSALDDAMLKLEAQLDDELSDVGADRKDIKEVTISLIYPHLRAGTLPLSARTRSLFPTAIESPRVRFSLVDGKSGVKIPAWAVLEHGYVFGLREWYKNLQLMPGSLVSVKRGQKPGEVIIEAKTQRAAKDWVRTLIVGADGGLVFAMLKQSITAEFNDRMAIHVPDFKALDPLWTKNRSFEDLVVSVMREMTKLTPQGHVHAQELYAAVNLVRRVPPAPLFALLASKARFIHVGDLHFRLEEI